MANEKADGIKYGVWQLESAYFAHRAIHLGIGQAQGPFLVGRARRRCYLLSKSLDRRLGSPACVRLPISYGYNLGVRFDFLHWWSAVIFCWIPLLCRFSCDGFLYGSFV